MKKIVLVFIEAPVPFAGAASRWYYTLTTELMKSDFQVEVYASCAKEEHMFEAKKLFPNGHFYLYDKSKGFFKKLKTLMRPFSYTISEQMKSEFNIEIQKGYDIIHVEQTFASWILDAVDEKCILSVHYLSHIDLFNVSTNSIREWLTMWLMKRTEKKLIGRFHNIKSCSQRIEDLIKTWYPNRKYINFPFGIDISQYQFNKQQDRPSNVLTVIANMGWYPGKSAAVNLIKNIWPELKRKRSDLKLRIVGWNAKSALKDYLDFPDIEIRENVPNITEYFYNATAMVYLPSQGSGIKIKIQESMLLGLPVITNEEGAEGLDLVSGQEAIIVKNNEESIPLILNFLSDIHLQNQLRNDARIKIEKTCDGKVIVEDLKRYYQSLF